jgi:peptide/nickel transport system ATP-binding protein
MTAHLEIKSLSLVFRTRQGSVRALEDVSLAVERGEIMGVVGESGSGKSVTAFTVMGLNDRNARVESGSITLGGVDMLNADPEALRALRGREIAMIFQSPRTALSPIRSVGKHLEDVLREHSDLPRGEIRRAAVAALARVRIPDPERRYSAYPFELSGGMCQRVMIAMALACAPTMLIADEPTTGLDVTTQAVIMDLIADMSRLSRMSTLLITHDLALAGEYCDRIAVMRGGRVVEVGPTERILNRPEHEYTRQLLAATPGPGSRIDGLAPIAAAPPEPPPAASAPIPFRRRATS